MATFQCCYYCGNEIGNPLEDDTAIFINTPPKLRDTLGWQMIVHNHCPWGQDADDAEDAEAEEAERRETDYYR